MRLAGKLMGSLELSLKIDGGEGGKREKDKGTATFYVREWSVPAAENWTVWEGLAAYSLRHALGVERGGRTAGLPQSNATHWTRSACLIVQAREVRDLKGCLKPLPLWGRQLESTLSRTCKSAYIALLLT